MQSRPEPTREDATTGMCIALFFILALVKAITGHPDWIIITSPIWGRFLFLVIVYWLEDTGRK